MKRALVLLLLAAVGISLYRRFSGPRGSGRHGSSASGRAHRHGTPDEWPPVVRKPGARPARAAPD